LLARRGRGLVLAGRRQPQAAGVVVADGEVGRQWRGQGLDLADVCARLVAAVEIVVVALVQPQQQEQQQAQAEGDGQDFQHLGR